MKLHGDLTVRMGQMISQALEGRGYDVFYDHGTRDLNVGTIASSFGEGNSRRTQLTHLDIAVVEQNTDKAIALIEIEETNARPKALVGDLFGFLLGERITSKAGREFRVGNWTTLMVFGRSEVPHQQLLDHLREKAEAFKSTSATGNSKIGRVVIESFSDEEGLWALLSSRLERALKGAP